MKRAWRIGVVVLLAAAVAVTISLKKGKTGSETPDEAQPQRLPKLVDLGAGKCIPCKMMAPILEELRKEFAGKLEVVVIDVWENPEAAKNYRVKVIPTQVFYDSNGVEFFRHEGFFSKEDILTKFRAHGVKLLGPML